MTLVPLLNPKFAIAFAARCARTSGSGHQWRFAPGAETGGHRHGCDYVVVPMTTGTLLIDDGRSQVRSELVAGRSYARPAGVEHNVINDNIFEFSFIEVELK